MKIALIVLAMSCVGLIVLVAFQSNAIDRERNKAEYFETMMFRLLVKYEGWRRVPDLPRPMPPAPELINDRQHEIDPADTAY